MWWCWSDRTAPARPIASRRSRFCRRDAACAAPRSTMSPTSRATARGRCPPRSRARSGLATLGTGIDAPGSEAAATSRRCRIDREPVSSATAFGDHLRMVWLTPSMDGLFTGAASERRRFFDRLVLAIDSEHSARVSALDRSLAIAQSPARGAQFRRPLVRRDRARDRRTRGRGRGDARPDPDETRRDAARARRAIGLSLRRHHARRLDGKRADERAGHLGGGPLPRDPAPGPRPRRRRRPHARRSASHRSAGDLRAEEHAGPRRLHRRAEGAADRAGAGACQSGRRDDRHHAAACCSTRSSRISIRTGARRCSTNWPSSAPRSG